MSKIDESITAALEQLLGGIQGREFDDQLRIIDRCMKWSELNKRHVKGKFGEGLDEDQE